MEKHIHTKSAGSRKWATGSQAICRFAVFLLFAVHFLLFAVLASDDDHSHGNEKSGVTGVSVTNAERNIKTESGSFNVRVVRTPNDPRAGEVVQFGLILAEKVEGGFSADGNTPLENAVLTANIVYPNGSIIAENIVVKAEKEGKFQAEYVFRQTGDFKIVFNATTSDNRNFSADFPVSVVSAPINWRFWLGFGVISLMTIGGIAMSLKLLGRDKNWG